MSPKSDNTFLALAVAMWIPTVGLAVKQNHPIQITSANLTVNQSPHKRYKTCMNYNEGLAQIQKLADNKVFEEAWAFAPQESCWYEIGEKDKLAYDLSKQKYQIGLELNYDVINILLHNFDEIRLVHYHPKLELIIQDFVQEETQVLQAEAIETNLSGTYIHHALPSTEDIKSMIDLTREVDYEYPGKKVIFTVATNHSVIDYGLTLEGLTKYKGSTRHSTDFPELEAQAAEVARNSNINPNNQDPTRLRQLTEALSNEDIEVSYYIPGSD